MTEFPEGALNYVEQILVRIKRALKDTALNSDLTVGHNGHLGPGSALKDVVLKCEGDSEFSAFLCQYWAHTRGEKGLSYFVAHDTAPSTLIFRTTNRLAIVEHAALMADLFDGEKIEFTEMEHTWQWDKDFSNPESKSIHRTVYTFNVIPFSSKKFKASKWIRESLAHVCASKDPRADEYMFEYITHNCGTGCCVSYQEIKSGFTLGFNTKKIAEDVVAKLFHDCMPAYGIDKEHGLTEVTLTFPDMQKAAA